MSPPSKSIRNANGGKSMDDSETASNNLWVGNLSPDVTESDLTSLFSKYGAVDSITAYASRCYAFVYFKRVQDAKAALEALNGTYLQGNSLKIEFAKPAKPCKSLWVSGISPSIKKEVLEEEFLKFGKIEEFKFLRERNTAYIDYSQLEDAFLALKNMNGKRIGGDQIRVDFLRSHSIRREPWADYRDPRDGQKHSQSSGGRKGDGQPSNILWVGYPPSVHIDEQMLHNAMILFGEIERIRSFPSRNYSFVEFRSVDEARLAKEGLQGRLFNDPRITIMYSSSGQAASKDYPGFYPGVMGPRPDVLFDEPPFHPAHVDMFNHTRSMVPNALSRPTPSSGILGPNMLMRPLGPQGSFEPLLSGPEFNDLTAVNKVLDADPNSLVGGPSWRRSSPAPAIFPSPSQGGKRPTKPLSSGAWDVFDANQLERESKRSRIDSVLPGYDPDFPSRKMDIRGSGLDQFYGLAPRVDGIPSGQLSNVQEKNIFGPPEVRITPQGTGQGYADHDYIWRGVIAKGGTPVCRARCVPVGEGIESEIPEVVNCSARTGLDMLTKHYADAIGFDVVFFLPDSEEDFASYTEFLRYLGAKDRAGVAKFDDATTLFLVPPSDFLYKVLKVVGPERLYGVVLKFPQHAPSSPSVPPQSFQSQYVAGHQMPSLNVYSGMHQKEEKVLQMDYSRVFHEDSLPPTKQLAHSTANSIPMQPAPSVNTSAESQAGIKLTPELIATLASLLPAGAKFSVSKVAEPSVGSSSMKPSLPPPELDRGLLPRVWTHDVQGLEQTGHTVHQLENQYNPQRQQLAQHQAYPTGVSTSSDFAMGLTVQSQVQDPAFQLSQQGTVSSRPLSNFGVPSQSGQMAVPHAVNQQHQYEVPQNTQKGFGVAHGTDSLGSYGSSIHQQSANSVMFPNQVHGSDVTHPHMAMPLAADKGISELPNQVQQLQSAPYGASQGSSEVEVDKNQRYQSTLQFAANLLLQLQQQQTGTHGGQGSANQ